MPKTQMNSTTLTNLSKWHLALALFGAGALGLGYWYMKTGNKKKLKNTRSSESNISIDEDERKKFYGESEIIAELSEIEQSLRYKNNGNQLFRNGEYAEAIAQYTKAIEICPKDSKLDLATYYQNRAAAYGQLKEWQSVIDDCTKAIDLNGRYEKALLRRAKATEAIHDWEKCLDDVTSLCLLQQFKNKTTLIMADKVLRHLGRQHAREAMKTRKPIIPSKSFIHTYFSSFSCDPVYQKIMETIEPLGQGDLHGFLKAKLAFATEKYDEIIPACTEEIENSNSDYKIEALALRATFYFFMGSFDEALSDLTAIIETEGVDTVMKALSYVKRASIYMQTERFGECLDDFTNAIETNSKVSDIYLHRGQLRLLMESTDQARDDFETAFNLNTDFAIAFVQKIFSDYRHAIITKNPDLVTKSMFHFSQALVKFPHCTETYVLYAQVLTERQEFQKADDLFKKALKIDEKNASVYVHRALLYLQWKDNIEEAIHLIKEAIRIDDKCEFAYETLGTIEVQRSNLVIAIDLFNKAIECARTEMELTHLFSLRDAASSQLRIATKLGISPEINHPFLTANNFN